MHTITPIKTKIDSVCCSARQQEKRKNLSETFLKMRTVFMLSESGGLRGGWWIDDSKWTAVEVFRRTLSQSVFVSWFIRMNERCAVAPGRG